MLCSQPRHHSAKNVTAVINCENCCGIYYSLSSHIMLVFDGEMNYVTNYYLLIHYYIDTTGVNNFDPEYCDLAKMLPLQLIKIII